MPTSPQDDRKARKELAEIASAYSWDELLEEAGIDTVTAAETQLWLEERGASLGGHIDRVAHVRGSSPSALCGHRR